MDSNNKLSTKSVTSISLETDELEQLKAHAKSEGIGFSKMVKILFLEDMEAAKACKSDPVKIIERIKLKQKRLLILNENRLASLNLEELFKGM